MRETKCPNCCDMAEVICYRRDDPVVFCHKCGSYVLTIEMQENRDKYEMWTNWAILSMYREVAKMQKTFMGRIRLRIRIWLGWSCPGIKAVLRLDKRTAHLANYVK